jgi:acyl-CoA synthetase (AMP-forming)/AMP-acid ligase II/acyl carrier protein
MAKMLLLNEDSKAAFKKLDFLMIGGETFPVNLANQLGEIVDGEILNMYGPTETTIWSSTFKLNGELDSVPIGKPIANTEFFLLDENQQLVPIGVPGELYIGGEGVVRGYFQRPGLTNDRFIQHPFKNGNVDKVYKTGDLACYNKDGVIEFLGRLDHQVKIRGYRIELGEIETALEKHSLIREAVVIAREDTPGDKRLVAYMVSETPSNPAISDLRDYLKEKLPEYMIPSTYEFMVVFPLTPNGKVDRLSLPAPEMDRPEMEQEFIAPRTQSEKNLAKLWSEVLNIEEISIQDNFFDLGGHSLSAVQVTVKIAQAYNVELSLQAFFQASTLADLATKLEEKLIEQAEADQLEELLREVEQKSR